MVFALHKKTMLFPIFHFPTCRIVHQLHIAAKVIRDSALNVYPNLKLGGAKNGYRLWIGTHLYLNGFNNGKRGRRFNTLAIFSLDSYAKNVGPEGQIIRQNSFVLKFGMFEPENGRYVHFAKRIHRVNRVALATPQNTLDLHGDIGLIEYIKSPKKLLAGNALIVR